MSDLISRQDAIEAIASRDETDGTVKVFTGRQVNEILTALPSARPKGEWIPCEERLPREDEHDSELGVLVTLGNGYSGLTFDTYHEATEYYEAHWYDWDGYVIAWMPLPDPYKGGDDDANNSGNI